MPMKVWRAHLASQNAYRLIGGGTVMDVLSESLQHLPLRLIFRHMRINLINVRFTYAS